MTPLQMLSLTPLCQAHAPLVAKLAQYFESLEVESGFLNSEDSAASVGHILQQAARSTVHCMAG